jgi:GNAT superfamily N-acetyltransferase
LQLATDLELAAGRAEFFDVGPPAPAYLNRWVTVSPRLDAMLSIRFEGLDVTRPFVDAQHPAHAWQAQMQPAEDLQESMAAGTLYDVLVREQWARYVGATEDAGDNLGLPAYVVQEIILLPAYRGRGYGPHLSTLLARALPDEHRVLIGTVHAEYRGARAAALRADVGSWLQRPLGQALHKP